MKKFNHFLLATLFAAVLLTGTSCKKDDDDSNGKSKSELLIGNWVLTSDAYSPAYDYEGNGVKLSEIFQLYDACEKDDLLIFKTGNAGEYNEGSSKCDPSDDQAYPFTWVLTNNDNTITVGGDDYNLVQLNASTLKVAETFIEDGITYTNTYTYARK